MCFEVPYVLAAMATLRTVEADIAFAVTIDGSLTAFVCDCAGNLPSFRVTSDASDLTQV